MKYLLPVVLLFLFPSYGIGNETDSVRTGFRQNKAFIWGAKIGFNSALPVINSLMIDDVEISHKTRVEYKVGYMAAVFCRLNFDRFFIQPGFELHRTESDFYFGLPDESEAAAPVLTGDMNNQLNLRTYSFDFPVLIGYNIVKEGPFGLSVMAGSKVKYNYDIRYISSLDNYTNEYTSNDNPFRVNLLGGIGVTLWQLFIDFTYEVGLNYRESKFQEVKSGQPLPNTILLDKRMNMMGFSFGVLF